MVARQPNNTPPSGQQYPDQFEELLDELWIIDCTAKNKTRDAVDVEAEEIYCGIKAAVAEEGVENGGGSSSPSGANKEVENGGGGSSPPDTGREALAGDKSGGPTVGQAGPQPAEGMMEGTPAWYAQQAATKAAVEQAGAAPLAGEGDAGIKQEKADSVSTGKVVGSTEPPTVSKYPARPQYWMHPLTLSFCLFGRPSGSEDIDLTAKTGSGPPGDRRPKLKKNMKPSPGSSGSAGAAGGAKEPVNPLSAAACDQFVGAGESQSRTKVKKEAAKIAAETLNQSVKQEGLLLAREQAAISKEVAAAVAQVAKDVHRGRELEEEAAQRKRKEGAISDLRGELGFLDPDEPRAKFLRAEIGRLYRTPVTAFSVGLAGVQTEPPAATSASTPVATQAALPSFAGSNHGGGGGGGR